MTEEKFIISLMISLMQHLMLAHNTSIFIQVEGTVFTSIVVCVQSFRCLVLIWYLISFVNNPQHVLFQIIALWNSRFSIVCDILRNCYEAFALYSFWCYLVACLGKCFSLYLLFLSIALILYIISVRKGQRTA